MAPRTFCWFKRECLSPDTECINLVALVFENSELFEAEAAELSIEESDDSSSLLIRNDSLFGEISAEECGTLPRSLHLGLSAHSLATTSVVTPTHHAQTIEYNLISTSTSDARINPNETNSDVYKPLSSLSLCNSHQLQDFISTLPVHVLNAVSLSITTPRSPSLWPLHLLAYADSPTFVRAVTSDLKRFCTCFNGYRSENSDLVDVISCDLASDLTTCNLSCCQAEVDLFQCTTPSLADCQVNYSNPSLSPPALISYDNLPNNHKLSFLVDSCSKVSDINKTVLSGI
ncbi:unnamed protein product [Heterobilharzia americana]|nr:unnamed protein product [Heterobilharzia americana]